MSKERDLGAEETLLMLTQILEGKEGIKVDKNRVKVVENFVFKVNGEQTKEPVLIIPFSHNGKYMTKIYNSKGKPIATLNETLVVNEDVELNKDELMKELENIEEAERINALNEDDETSDSTNAREGRDKPQEENAEKEEKQENKNESQKEKSNKDILENIAGEVNLDNKPLILLETVIDEKSLFDRLQLRYKIANKLPEGVNVESFTKGYLTYVSAEELTAKDGKERNGELVPVITTQDKSCVIELPENVLELQENGSYSEQIKREQTRIEVDEFGNTVRNPKNQSQLSDIARFKIKDDGNINGPNIEYITFRENEAHKRNGINDQLGYNTEIYYEKGPKGDIGTVDREKGYYTFAQELQPEKRARIADTSEKEANRDRNMEEKQTTREAVHDHFSDLAKEILEENPDLESQYGERDVMEEIRKQVENNVSLDDDEIKANVKNSLESQRVLGDGYNGRQKH